MALTHRGASFTQAEGLSRVLEQGVNEARDDLKFFGDVK